MFILDLSGNPIASEGNYRNYTIFTLEKLKILDGVIIEEVDVTTAKSLYEGRLTKDILEDRLGNIPMD